MNSYRIWVFIIVVVIVIISFVYGRVLANTNNVTLGSFQKITAIITCVILLIILIFIWGTLTYAKKDVPDAPIIAQCPDFWEIEETGAGPKCVNIQNLGTCPAASNDTHLTLDFKSGNFTDNCAKYTWANNCNIAWDGLTYGVANPCITAASTAAENASATATSKTIA